VKNALKAKISKERIGTEVIFTHCHGWNSKFDYDIWFPRKTTLTCPLGLF
jgi:hypothetical protein